MSTPVAGVIRLLRLELDRPAFFVEVLARLLKERKTSKQH